MNPITALEFLQKEQSATFISTSSAQLDGLLGAGIPSGQITEFCGMSGLGKTQLCMQLCINTQKLGFKAIYIDTEGGFSAMRLADMADSSNAILPRGRYSANIIQYPSIPSV